ncbi:MAG: hypothetical protein ACAI25_18555 [Planctomycetota bacterium]
MAGETKGAGRPAPPGSSVAFICGTAGWHDGFLLQGKKWVKTIQTKAGGAPKVLVGEMGTSATSLATLIADFSRQSQTADLPVATLDATLGGLRAHTLVFVTHGLENHDPNISQKEKEDTQGLLVFNAVQGDSPKDRVIFKMHLDFMTVKDAASGIPEDAQVIPKPDLASITDEGDGKKFKKDVTDFAPVLTAIRRSVYSHLYFAACGGGRRLEKFAEKMKELTRKSIFWNDDTISFPTLPVAPFAEVGPIKDGKTQPIRDGTPFFKPDGALVKLQTGTDDFFKGSMRRLP